MSNLSSVSARRVPTQADIEAVCSRLETAAYSLLAIHKMAKEDNDPNGFLRHGIERLARAEVQGIDACIGKLGGTALGNFENEFDAEAE